MSYIGSTPQTQAFTPAVDYFNGTGSTTSFTLSRPVASVAQIQVVVDNVPQNPSSAYTVSGNTITFTSAPLSGTNNIYVEYTSPITQYNALSESPVVYGNLNFGSTGARIQGDFSNATQSNRVAFQTSTANNSTNLQVIPNGTSQQSAIDLNGSSALTNQARFTIRLQSDEATIRSAIDGTGTYLPMTFYTGGSERMRIDSSGNVGIGTSSPNISSATTKALTIASASGQDDAMIEMTQGSTIYGRLYSNGNGLGITGTGGIGIRFYTASTFASAAERMRITNNGDVLVGTASLPSNGGRFNVVGGDIACDSGYRTKAGNTTTLGGNRFNINWTGTAQLWIDSTNVGTFAFTSDYRIKQNIQTNTMPALERIEQLRPVTYEFADYKELFKEDGVQREGFIAHELAEIIPSAVEGEKDAEDQIQSLKLDALCSVMVKAIQEQQELIKSLTTRIETLEAK